MSNSEKEARNANKQDYLALFENIKPSIKSLKNLKPKDYEAAYFSQKIDERLKSASTNSKNTFLIECLGNNIKLKKEHWLEVLRISGSQGYALYTNNFESKSLLYQNINRAFENLKEIETFDSTLFENLKDVQINKKTIGWLNNITKLAYQTNQAYELPWLFENSLVSALKTNNVNNTMLDNLKKLRTCLPDLMTSTIDTHIYGPALTALDLIETYEKSKNIKSYSNIINNLNFETTSYNEIHKWLSIYKEKEIFEIPNDLKNLLLQNRAGAQHRFSKRQYKALQYTIKYGMSYSELEAEKGTKQDIVDLYKKNDPSEKLRALDHLDDMLVSDLKQTNELRVELMDYYSVIMDKEKNNNSQEDNIGVVAIINFITTFGRSMSDIITSYAIGTLDDKPELIKTANELIHTHIDNLITISKIGKMFDVVKVYMHKPIEMFDLPDKSEVACILNIYTINNQLLNDKLKIGIELGLNDLDLISFVQTAKLNIPDITPENNITF